MTNHQLGELVAKRNAGASWPQLASHFRLSVHYLQGQYYAHRDRSWFPTGQAQKLLANLGANKATLANLQLITHHFYAQGLQSGQLATFEATNQLPMPLPTAIAQVQRIES